jgi:hypothetical protein
MEKTIVVEAVRTQVPVMIEHLQSAGSHTGRLAQIVRVGKHELELIMDKTVSGARAEDPALLVRSKQASSWHHSIILWVIIAIFVIVFIIAGYHY